MSGTDTEQRPPPPPPPPSGSPFGRFLTSPVLLVGVIALVVAFAGLRWVGYDGGGGATGPEPGDEGLAGTWAATGTALPYRLELANDGTGTLTNGPCTGSLAPRRTDAETAVLVYTDTSGEPDCPQRARLTVTLVDADTLRVVERRGGREEFSGTLTRGA